MTNKGIAVRFPDTAKSHISSEISKPVVAPTQPQLGLFPRVQVTKDVVDHLTQPSAVVMKEWSNARAPHIPSWRSQL